MIKQTLLAATITLITCQMVSASEVKSFPILNAIEESGGTLSKTTKKWMKRWQGMNLDDSSLYSFKEISGTTSINLKIQKVDQDDPKGFKSMGSFVTKNEAANPNTEIAYFNLAAIIGADSFFRPTIRYDLGEGAKLEFKKLLNSTPTKGAVRSQNKMTILKALDKEGELPGCVKAKKEDSNISLNEILSTSLLGKITLKPSHPVVKFIQADSIQPKKGDTIVLKKEYTGDALELAREFSIILTLDVVFGQYDRLSGDNIVIMKDENQIAHFYATDNGGAYVTDSVASAKKTSALFSRFDRKTILKLKELNEFLNNPAIGFLGYTDAEKFVVDMGMYFDRSPARYVRGLKENLAVLLTKVKETEARYKGQTYFEE